MKRKILKILIFISVLSLLFSSFSLSSSAATVVERDEITYCSNINYKSTSISGTGDLFIKIIANGRYLHQNFSDYSKIYHIKFNVSELTPSDGSIDFVYHLNGSINRVSLSNCGWYEYDFQFTSLSSSLYSPVFMFNKNNFSSTSVNPITVSFKVTDIVLCDGEAEMISMGESSKTLVSVFGNLLDILVSNPAIALRLLAIPVLLGCLYIFCKLK